MELEVKSAEAAGQIQFAINLLNPRLNQFIQTKDVNKEKTDFNQSVQFISRKVKQFFPQSKNESGLRKCFRRANEIRNEYSHQNFDTNRFEHDVECLAKIASYIGAKDVEQKILALISFEDASSTKSDSTMWLQLKDEGNKHYKKSEWTESMNCYTKAIRLNPKVATLYSNRALCEIQLSKFQLAREDAEDAIELDPKEVKFYRILSDALFQLSLFEETLKILEIGLKINQRDEVLLLRQRDCKAMIKTNMIDRHPVAGGLQLFKEPRLVEKKAKQFFENKNRTDLLPEDILVVNIAQVKISSEIAVAHKILLGAKGCIKEESKALEIYESAAKKGNAEGLYNVSLMYSKGQAGLPRDFLKAREYCEKAAAQKPFVKFQGNIFPNIGVAQAENMLGIAYRDGAGIDQNYILAFQWFLKSAQHDCPSAQNNLGMALVNGRGCAQNLTSARAWFERASEFGQSESRFNLADMLIKGEGEPVDTTRASKLLKEAADQGLPGALVRLQLLLRSGVVSEKNMSGSQKLVEESASKEDVEAIFLLGFNYIEGTGGVEKNFDQAEMYLRRASQLNHPSSDFILGKLLCTMKKFHEAFHFIQKAADVRGDVEAQWLLGQLFAYGQGCERDEHQSRRWLLRAKRRGYQPNIFNTEIHGEEKDTVNDTIKLGQELHKFEEDQNLTNSSMSYIDRMERMMVAKSNNPKEVQKLLNFGKLEKPTPNVRSMKSEISVWMPEMLKRAEMGSITAGRFFQAQSMVFEAEKLLKRHDISRAFCLFRVATTRLWNIIRISVDLMESFYKPAVIALEKDSNDAEALFCILNYKAKIKFDQYDHFRMAQRCIELDPTIAEYHSVLGSIHGFRGDFANSYRCFERALELEPDPEWLYDLATSLRLHLENKNPSQIIQAYQKYLSLCQPDSRKVPESYYSIGFTYGTMGHTEKALEYFNKGLLAEQPHIRLPCFKPVEDEFPPKFFLLLLVNEQKKSGTEKMTNLIAIQCVDEVSNCEHCGKEGVPLRCGKCKIVKYCNRDCQKSHWKTHKKNCI